MTTTRIMTRRSSRWGAGGALVGMVAMAALVVAPISGAAPSKDHASSTALPSTLTIYSSGTVNVQNEWQKVLIPDFEKAYPGKKIKLVFGTTGETTVVYDDIAAAAKAGKDTQFDVVTGSVPAEAGPANLLVKVNSKELPNLDDIRASTLTAVDGEAVPLRGSQVLIAYNSTVVKNPPKTLAALIKWIKANPGKFSYCNPSDGGSGEGFVQDVLSSYTPASVNTKLALGYDPSLESYWDKGLSVLKSLTPDVFQGQYPTSNTAVLTELGSGAIDIGSVWSDEATEALDDGQLPKTVKLAGISPPMPGGPDYIGVPKNIPASYQKLAFEFINWTLTPQVQGDIVGVMYGTPGIEIKDLPAAYQSRFAGYPPPQLPYSSKSESDMARDWTSQVG